MLRAYNKFIHAAGSLIDTEAPAAGPPPRTLWRFMAWSTSGAWPVIILGGLLSIAASTVEVSTLYLLGRVVDVATLPNPTLGEHFPLLILAVFLMLLARPVLFGCAALIQSVMIGPNLFKQALTRLHRWTVGQ